MGFSKFNLNDTLMQGIDAIQYKEPTPVQEKAIPVIFEGKDLMSFAQTGTGKTAAFLIPLIQRFDGLVKHNIKCLILVPTRELAQQIEAHITGLAYFTSVTFQAVYGGNQSEIFSVQKNSLVKGVDVVIATPGRMMQHHNMGYVNFDDVEVFILDEADRMLDMGFIGDIMQINSLLPEKKQTLMFSATMDDNIKKLARRLLNKPEEISLAIAKPAEGINQLAYLVFNENKAAVLEEVLKNQHVKNMIVFVSRKSEVDRVARKLLSMKFNVAAIHSDKTQEERNEAMRLFKAGKYDVLVATNIVSRGIDIEDLSHVVNYDIPDDAVDYVHRIGRTARAGKEGAAISFINPADQNSFAAIERLIEKEIIKYDTPEKIGKSPLYRPGTRKSSGRSGGRPGGKGRYKGSYDGKKKSGQSYGSRKGGRSR